MKSAAVGAFLLALSYSGLAGAQGFDIDAYLAFRQPIRTALSPDGARTAVSVEYFDRTQDDRHSEVLLLENATGVAQRVGDGGEPAFCSGGSIGVLRRQGSAQRFHVLNFSGRDDISFAGLNVTTFSCDPVAARAILVANSAAPPSSLRDAPAPDGLYIADFSTGEIRRLSDAEGVSSAEWSPNGDALVIAVNDDLEIVTLDGRRTSLVRRAGRDLDPHWSPDGRRIAFLTSGGVERAPVGLAVVDRRGRTVRALATGFPSFLINAPPRWHGWENNGQLLFSGLRDMTNRVYRVRLSHPEEAIPLTPDLSVSLGCSTANGRLACLDSTPNDPPRVVVRTLSDRRIVQAYSPNLNLTVADAHVERFDWTARDGRAMSGLLMTPAGDRPSRAPLVVFMMGSHGVFDYSFTSRQSADDTWFPPINQRMLLAAGYSVLMPNPRGSWSFGAEFQGSIAGDPAIGPSTDVEAGVDALIASGLADPDRLAIVGIGYYDTYRLAYTLTQTTRYRAAIDVIPVFSLAQFYGNGAVSRRYMGGSPLLEPDRFAPFDPSRNVGAVHTPVLFFELDDAAPASVVGAAQAFATGLTENNVPNQVLRYGEPILDWPKPSALAETARATLAFLAEHMNGPRPQPAPPASH